MSTQRILRPSWAVFVQPEECFGGIARWHSFSGLKSKERNLDEWCNSSIWKVSLRWLSHLVSTTYEAAIPREWIDRYWRTYKMDKCAMIIWNITPIGSETLMKTMFFLSRSSFFFALNHERVASLTVRIRVAHIRLLDDDVDVCLSLYSINHWINRQRRREKENECDTSYASRPFLSLSLSPSFVRWR